MQIAQQAAGGSFLTIMLNTTYDLASVVLRSSSEQVTGCGWARLRQAPALRRGVAWLAARGPGVAPGGGLLEPDGWPQLTAAGNN